MPDTVGNSGTYIKNIDFPTFTADLITGVFDALQSNHLTQIKAYSELLEATSKSLSSFIEENKDRVESGEILEFLSNKLQTPVILNATNNKKAEYLGELYDALPKTDASGSTLLNDNAESLSSILLVSTPDNIYSDKGHFEKTDIKTKEHLLEAVRIKIAAQRQGLLKDMVRMGMMRLVVTDGEIKTRLMFSASISSTEISNASQYNYKGSSWGVSATASGKFGAFKFGISGGYSSSKVQVSTLNESSINNSSAKVDLFGSVRLNIKTDYFPLGPAEDKE